MLEFTAAEAARRFGDRPAYVAQREAGSWHEPLELTYSALERISSEVAAGLVQRGVRPGDRVAIILAPCIEYAVLYVAIAKAGAIAAGVNDRLGPAEQRAMLDRCAPTLVVCGPGFNIEGFPTIAIKPCRDVAAVCTELRNSHESSLPRLDADRDIAIIFTSGTTGLPKGARYGTKQLEFITRTDVGEVWGSGGRSFTGTSFAHLGFMTKLPGNLQRGSTNFIVAKWRAREALELLSEQRMTTVAGVPTHFALMLRDPKFDSFDLDSVQYIVSGGGPISAGLATEARKRFAAQLQTRYSCTEAGIGLGTAFDDPLEDAVLTVGRPHPAVSLALRNSTDPHDRTDVRIGEIGEVCLRSQACMSGYWGDAEATAAAFTADGFVRTGDLGYLDDHGRLRLVGRSKEMYVRGGYNVYPVEVEGVLSKHPDVASVAVVSQPDDVMGEIGIACVVLRDGASPLPGETLREFASSELAAYKLPHDVAMFAELPLTAMDKVDRPALRAEVTLRRSAH